MGYIKMLICNLFETKKQFPVVKYLFSCRSIEKRRKTLQMQFIFFKFETNTKYDKIHIT